MGDLYADPPQRFEAGTPPIAQAIGLGAAIDYVSALGMDNIAAHERQLVEYLLGQLRNVEGVRVLGSDRADGSMQPPGSAAIYLVTDDPDAVFEAAVAAGGSVDREMVDQDYGGRGGSVRDPEGSHWSFGSFQPGSAPEA